MNDIKQLSERMIPRAEKFLARIKELEIPIAVLETRRPQVTQDAYYAQGRKPLEEVNALRAKAGLGPLGEAANKNVVTRTTRSNHTLGDAMDIIPLRPNGSWDWDTKSPTAIARWLKLGEVGRECGLRWGGDWKDRPTDVLGWDCPHFEFDPAWKEGGDAV